MNTYSSYKDSGVEWIGEVPGEWNVKRLDHFFTERKDKVDDVSYPPLSVTMKGIKDQLEGVAKSDDSSNRKLVLKSDFVINSRSDRKGSSGISFRDGSVSLINTVLEPKNIEPNYVNYLFKSYYFIEEYFRFGKGIHFDLWSTNYSVMKNIKIPVLSIEEQQQISDYLDYKTLKIDTLIEKTQQKIELLKEQRTSLINTTVTKGLNPNVEMKDSRVEWIGEIPSEWEVVKLKFVGKVVIGLSYSPDNVVDEGEGTLVMRSTNVQNGKPSFHNNVYVNKDIPDRMVTREGDILICSRNGSRNLIGKNCIISKDIEGMTFGVFMTIFRSKYWKLIYWVLNSPVFKSQSGLYLTSTINQLTVSTIKNLTIPFTFNEREQQQIVDYLDKETSRIDKLVDIESKRIYLLKEYRQSLISEVVTGKVDVRDEVLV
jgi:type I restriction enzyme S subunit